MLCFDVLKHNMDISWIYANFNVFKNMKYICFSGICFLKCIKMIFNKKSVLPFEKYRNDIHSNNAVIVFKRFIHRSSLFEPYKLEQSFFEPLLQTVDNVCSQRVH